MKTTLDLPDELVKETKLYAIHEGKKLKDAIADLLDSGLATRHTRAGGKVKPDAGLLKRRRAITQKFVSGEWAVEVKGFEAGQEADRKAAARRARGRAA